SRDRRASRMTTVLTAALVLASGLAAWGWLRPRPSQPVTRAYLKFSETEAPTLKRNSFALLPDGSALVYVGKASSGTQVWMKKRSELHATPLAGTSGASNVFVSPDGRWIGFIAGGKVKKMPVAGGEVTAVAD